MHLQYYLQKRARLIKCPIKYSPFQQNLGWHLFIRSQQRKHENSLENMFKVNNKDTGRRSGVEFEQVNAD